MHRLIEKFHLDRFLRSGAVLMLDTVISVAASVLVLFLSNIFFSSVVLDTRAQLWWTGGSLLFSVAAFLLFRTHELIIRHSSLREVGVLGLAVLCKGALLALMVSLLPWTSLESRRTVAVLVLDMLVTFAALLSVRVVMLVTYDALKRRSLSSRPRKRVLVYGTDEKAVAMVTRLKNSPHYRVVGFLVPGTAPEKHTVAGLRVFYFRDDRSIAYLKENAGMQAVLFARTSDARAEQSRLIRYCVDSRVRCLIAPQIDEVIDGRVMASPVRKINIEDLLGREEIRISTDEIGEMLRGRTVLVTGAAGSIGSELCRQLAAFGVGRLVLYDNAETPVHDLRLELAERFPGLDLAPVIGDVRLPRRLDFAFRTTSTYP